MGHLPFCANERTYAPTQSVYKTADISTRWPSCITEPAKIVLRAMEVEKRAMTFAISRMPQHGALSLVRLNVHPLYNEIQILEQQHWFHSVAVNIIA
eukprot:scaffold267049_cov15-Prasinocladus_malaysianus.AAC.2